MLHLFEDLEVVTSEIARVATPCASLFMASLIAERRLSAVYLSALHRAGEVAQPRTGAELARRLNEFDSGFSTPGGGAC